MFSALSSIKLKFPEANVDEIKKIFLNYHDILIPYSKLIEAFPALTLQQANTIRELVMDPATLIELKSKFKEIGFEELAQIYSFYRSSLNHSTRDLIHALNRFEANAKSKGYPVTFRDAFKQASFSAELKKKKEGYFHRLFPI